MIVMSESSSFWGTRRISKRYLWLFLALLTDSKRGKDEPISLDGIYANTENEYNFEIVDSFGRLSAIQLDLSKNLSVDYKSLIFKKSFLKIFFSS